MADREDALSNLFEDESVPALKNSSVQSLENQLASALGAAKSAGVAFVRNHMKAGAALLGLKELVGHGEWLPLLEKHGINTRTAQFMMQRASLIMEKHGPKYESRFVFPPTIALLDVELGIESAGAKRILLMEKMDEEIRDMDLALDAGDSLRIESKPGEKVTAKKKLEDERKRVMTSVNHLLKNKTQKAMISEIDILITELEKLKEEIENA